MRKSLKIAGFTATAVLMCATLAAQTSQQEVIGKWIDSIGTFWRQEIEIVKKGPAFYRISTFQDGSTSRSELLEVKAKSGERRRFEAIKSSHGEIYALNAKGNLDLYDKEGFIREARKEKS